MICPRCGVERSDEQRTCPACGLSRADSISERAERRVVTVLFADISGFTALSEELDPEEVREIINLCLEELVSVVHRYGGTVDKFIGDAVMAIFGAPHAHEDDAERAVAAALEMRQGLVAVSERLGSRLPHPLALHVGINTGMVVAGRVGSLDRSDYTVLGDTVNLAARLEDASVGGQILAADETYDCTKHAFSYRELPAIAVKGKRDPVPVFELLGVRARRRSRRGIPGMHSPFIGRDRERQRLLSAIDALTSGCGGLITLGGPAGVGKSRLLLEAKTAAEERRIPWIQGGASALGQDGVLALWADIARRLLAPEAAAQPRQDVSVVLPLPGRARTTVALADILGLTLPPEERHRVHQLDEAAIRGQIFLALRELLNDRTAKGPLVLALEDLHWADEASFDLLGSVMDLTARGPLLVIGTYRSDATTVEEALPPAGTVPGSTRTHIELSPLSEEECRSLATAVLGTDERLAPVRELLVEQAEGNPLYLEEILRALADQGAITPAGSGWQLAAETVEAVLPASLQGLLLDRIDRLPEHGKRLLQIASVAGRQFPAALVAEITGDETVDSGRLADLIRDGFLEQVDEAGMLRFRHALIQEATYSSLLLRHRRSYHRRVAEALEARPALWPAPAELPAVLAHHWERSEDWTKAAQSALHAADLARRTFAPAEASRLYARALAAAGHIDDPTVTRAALTGMADAALARGDAEHAIEILDEALRSEAPPLEQAALTRRRGQALARLGMQANAGEAFHRAAALLGEPQPDEPDEVRRERATIRMQAAFAHLARGAILLARAAAEEAVRLGSSGDGEADAHRLLGVIELLEGNPEDAAARFEAALAIAEPIRDLPRVATIREQLGVARLTAGDGVRGGTLLTGALQEYRRLGDRAGAARCLTQLGTISLSDGALGTAIERLQEAIEESGAGAEPQLSARAGLALGRAFALAGRWDEAIRAFERAGADDDQAAGEATLEAALVEVARGRSPEGGLRAALVAADHAKQRAAADRARLGLAALARRGGRTSEARTLLRGVIEDAPDPYAGTVIEARAALAHVAAGEGRFEAALAVASETCRSAEGRAPASVRWYATRVYGIALSSAGRDREAEPVLRAVVESTRAAGALPYLAAALSAWARCRRALGDPTGAADALAELRIVAARLAESGAG